MNYIVSYFSSRPQLTANLKWLAAGISIGIVIGYAWHLGAVLTHPEIYGTVGR